MATEQRDHDLLIEVSANVKNLSSNIQNYMASNSATSNDHEVRIRTLEKSKDQNTGSQMSRKEMISWIVAIGAIVSATWWLPELIRALTKG